MSRRMYDFVPLDVADRDWQKHRAETADDVLKAAIRGEKGKGISFHAWERMEQRQITYEEVKEAYIYGTSQGGS